MVFQKVLPNATKQTLLRPVTSIVAESNTRRILTLYRIAGVSVRLPV